MKYDHNENIFPSKNLLLFEVGLGCAYVFYIKMRLDKC